MSNEKCMYYIPWIGPCGDAPKWFSDEHLRHKDARCVDCGEPAVRGCEYGSSIICGRHVCEDHRQGCEYHVSRCGYRVAHH